MNNVKRFKFASELPAISGAEDWRELYNWYHVLDKNDEKDNQSFWFQDSLHHPEVMRPYDEIQCECWWQGLGAFNTRIFAMPPAFGVDQRIVNGYLYVAPIPAPEKDIAERIAIYEKRSSFYYDNWDSIYAEWKTKVLKSLDSIRSISFEPLPDIEPEEVVTSRRGYSTGYKLIHDYHHLVLTMYETYQYHFELLNIGYAAYLSFFSFMKKTFPSISDYDISAMLGGLRVELYRPDDELKRLSKRAIELDISNLIIASDAASIFGKLKANTNGALWLKDWEETSDPWFIINTDSGHPGGYSHNRTWKDNPEVPLSIVKEYIKKLHAGVNIDRPTEEILIKRDELTSSYRNLIAEDQLAAFDELLQLGRKVFAYIEEHVLYIEHWMWATFWTKSRDLAGVLQNMGVFEDSEDFFMLKRYEVMETLYDVVAAWSVGTPENRSQKHWAPIIAKRKDIYQKLKASAPEPALGIPPENITEPFTVMLWGITNETIKNWLAPQSDSAGNEGSFKGLGASNGIAEGAARVISSFEELSDLQEGEILVCPATSPAWISAFSKAIATVSDIGGIMSHTAIVCREYKIPAVVGTGDACQRIKTGDRIRVDGSKGTVIKIHP